MPCDNASIDVFIVQFPFAYGFPSSVVLTTCHVLFYSFFKYLISLNSHHNHSGKIVISNFQLRKLKYGEK